MFKIIFVLYLAGVAIGQVGTHDEPMAQAACLKIVSDEENLEFVRQAVKESTGHDVEVEGVCRPV